jgi:hypothetical protein
MLIRAAKPRPVIIAARKAARAAGAMTYAGNPCHAGHDGTRYTATRQCVACAKAARVVQTEREKAERGAK